MLIDLLAYHVNMMQLEGYQEAKPKTIRAMIAAAILNMPFESNVTKSWIYERVRQEYPEVLNPGRVREIEERRAAWTTYPNINLWFDGIKELLIKTGLVEDKPMKVIDVWRNAGVEPPIPIDGEFV